MKKLSKNLVTIMVVTLITLAHDAYSSQLSLEEQYEINEKLIQSCMNKDIEGIQLLIEKGAQVDYKNKRGLSPLHASVYNGDLEAVELLCKKNADMNLKGPNGVTPLHYSSPYLDVMQALISAGADVNAKDDKDQTPLDTAVSEYSDIRLPELQNIQTIDQYPDQRGLTRFLTPGQIADLKKEDIYSRSLYERVRSLSRRNCAKILCEAGADYKNMKSEVHDKDYEAKIYLVSLEAQQPEEVVAPWYMLVLAMKEAAPAVFY